MKNSSVMKPSYPDIAEFIQFSGTHVDEDLQQLWRRILFNKYG
jgi:serine/threonine-protein kinase HipA